MSGVALGCQSGPKFTEPQQCDPPHLPSFAGRLRKGNLGRRKASDSQPLSVKGVLRSLIAVTKSPPTLLHGSSTTLASPVYVRGYQIKYGSTHSTSRLCRKPTVVKHARLLPCSQQVFRTCILYFGPPFRLSTDILCMRLRLL